MKYQKAINQISEIFSEFTQEEQLELISLSPVLKAIYDMGVHDYIKYSKLI